MAGTFIISLDCEGKWGIADRDRRIESGVITRSALIRAYESLLRARQGIAESVFKGTDMGFPVIAWRRGVAG
jgi:hypothetical protein